MRQEISSGLNNLLTPAFSFASSLSQSPAVQTSPAMQRKDVLWMTGAEMIIMHSGMEKAPMTFYKGPQA